MNEIKTFDFAIIGGGLAGCVLYNSLKKLNLSVLLVDNSPEISSSLSAAGIYNPIVFKRLTKSWNIDYLLEDLNDFYDEFERDNKIKIHYKSNIYKVIANEDEKQFWIKKSKEQDLSNYLNSNIIQKFEEYLFPNSGLGQIFNSGYVDVSNFIKQTKNVAKVKKEYFDDIFDYNSLILKSDKSVNSTFEYEYKDFAFNNIIFAEGHQAQNNPYFDKIKFKLTKGELLIINILDLNSIEVMNEIEKYILNKNLFLLPFWDTNFNKILFKVGATYEWDDLEESLTEKGKKEILDKFDKIFKFEYKVIEHKVGIRPTIIDRRPVIGKHLLNKNMYIFNGLGTKGVMIAPFLANTFINNYINKNINIPEKYLITNEINYNRFL